MGPVVLDIQRTAEPERVYRLAVRGELDAESSTRLINSLRPARSKQASVRLDLSGVTFIDCSGLAVLLAELRASREDGWRLEVDQGVSQPVRRIIEMTGVTAQVWP